MTLKTSNDKTFNISWAWAPVGLEEALGLELIDDRPLSEIAKDFEGVKRFERFSESEGDMIFEGYTELLSISRIYKRTKSVVQISLVKPM